MSPNDLAITKMEIELPHEHSHCLCCVLPREIVATPVSGSGSMVPVPGLTSVFIYPQLSISISTVPAHFQASSRGTPALSQSNPSLPLPLTFGSSIGHVLSFQIWRSARVRRSIVQRSAALHAAQLEMIGRNHDFP